MTALRHLTGGDFKLAGEKIPRYSHVARKTYDCSDLSCRAKIKPGMVYVRTVAYPDPDRFGDLPEKDMGRRGRMVEVKLHARCGISKGDREVVNRVCATLGIAESESSEQG